MLPHNFTSREQFIQYVQCIRKLKVRDTVCLAYSKFGELAGNKTENSIESQVCFFSNYATSGHYNPRYYNSLNKNYILPLIFLAIKLDKNYYESKYSYFKEFIDYDELGVNLLKEFKGRGAEFYNNYFNYRYLRFSNKYFINKIIKHRAKE